MKKTIVWFGIFCLISLLCACGQTVQTDTLQSLTFERGHGSMWGNQFYVDICPTQITCARYFPQNSSELTEVQALPIDEKDWQQIETILQAMPLEEEKTTLRDILWERHRLDGGAFYELTLTLESARGEKKVIIHWSDDPSSQQLESFLEDLVRNGGDAK